jgi:hypothetical protein
MKIMPARFKGTCKGCGVRFPAGTTIRFEGRGRAFHADCDAPASGGDFPPPSGRVHVFRTSGGEFYRNAAGRCEDAPCCGCCTI